MLSMELVEIECRCCNCTHCYKDGYYFCSLHCDCRVSYDDFCSRAVLKQKTDVINSNN